MNKMQEDTESKDQPVRSKIVKTNSRNLKHKSP